MKEVISNTFKIASVDVLYHAESLLNLTYPVISFFITVGGRMCGLCFCRRGKGRMERGKDLPEAV